MDAEQKNSALREIQRKERELARRLGETEDAADRELARAAELAAEIEKKARGDGKREADDFFRREMGRVEKTASQIQTDGRRVATRLREAGAERLDRAVEIVIETVLSG
jgi:vacuolar-type H+-ATPase subunit H